MRGATFPTVVEAAIVGAAVTNGIEMGTTVGVPTPFDTATLKVTGLEVPTGGVPEITPVVGLTVIQLGAPVAVNPVGAGFDPLVLRV